MNVILQPAGNKGGREHYVDTVANLVPLTTIVPLAPLEIRESINSTYLQGAAAMWGVTAGKKNVNVSKWEKISPGDMALFAQDKFLRSAAVVTHKFHSRELASMLWGELPDGDTWEYVYLLKDVRQVNIPDERFNQIAGYAPNARRQGFTVMKPEVSAKVIEYFGLYGDVQAEIEGRSALEDEIDREYAPEGSLDLPRLSSSRKEQAYHRSRLLRGGDIGECAICGKTLPKEFLVAAHIKKREHCTRDERLNNHVVMLNCKLGCDTLYEEGYVVVIDGLVQAGRSASGNLAVMEAVKMVAGRECKAWNSSSQTFFEWYHGYQS